MSLVAVNLDTGSLVAERVAVAATRAARRVGLMNRDSLEPGEALWIVPSRGVHTMWMRFAIDLVALDERGVVIDRVESLQPWRIRLPRAGTAGVLELAAGTLAQSGTTLGHRIQFERRNGDADQVALRSFSSRAADAARRSGAGHGAAASDGDGGSGGAKPPGVKR